MSLIASGLAGAVDVLNLLVTLLFAAMLVAMWKRLPLEHTMFGLVMFAAPIFRMTTTQPLVSMVRYVIVLYPAFVLWGIWGKNSWCNRALIYTSFPLALYLSAQFILWGWVG